jgi:preprotein translocase subunit SecB
MNAEKQTKLKFLSVDFPVVNFNAEQPFTGGQEIVVNIEPRVLFPKGSPNQFKIIQEVNVSAKGIFNIFIVAIGYFEFNDVEDDRLRHTFVNANAPAIMFPYIRAFISTLTSNLGNVMGTLNVPPQFFKGELPVIVE